MMESMHSKDFKTMHLTQGQSHKINFPRLYEKLDASSHKNFKCKFLSPHGFKTSNYGLEDGMAKNIQMCT